MHKRQVELGASMYVPAIQRPDVLTAIGNGEKFPFLRSLIFCTEDAVRADELVEALRNLSTALQCLNNSKRPLRFIRVRNPHIFGECLAMPGIEKIDGFVLPKVTASNLGNYLALIDPKHDSFMLMPTLETVEIFDQDEVRRLRQMLQTDPRLHERILCLRIGGNDLLNCLNIRKSAGMTIYDTPIGSLIARLVADFIPHGFGLTAPVFEAMDAPEVLAREVALDLNYGLFGKTAIHPDQVPLIEAGFAVNAQDYAEAKRILEPDARAVFRMGGRMCEPATHCNWASEILGRASHYGIR